MTALVAVDEEMGIGMAGKIPWHCTEDLKWFKDFTNGKSIVVGRRTFDSLPVLKNRKIYVLSREVNGAYGTSGESKDGNQSVLYIKDVNLVPNDAIVCGGAQIYSLFYDKITEFYVSKIKGRFNCDAFLPVWSYNKLNNYRLIKSYSTHDLWRYW